MKRNVFAALGLLAEYSKGIRTSSSAARALLACCQQQRLGRPLLLSSPPSSRQRLPFGALAASAITSPLSVRMSTSATQEGKEMTTEAAIYTNLQAPSSGLTPIEHLEVLNESHTHNVLANSETHFKVIIVSPAFEEAGKKTPIQRHRLVHKLLHDQLMDNGGTIHALSIMAKTPSQWQASGQLVPPSPQVQGR